MKSCWPGAVHSPFASAVFLSVVRLRALTPNCNSLHCALTAVSLSPFLHHFSPHLTLSSALLFLFLRGGSVCLVSIPIEHISFPFLQLLCTVHCVLTVLCATHPIGCSVPLLPVLSSLSPSGHLHSLTHSLTAANLGPSSFTAPLLLHLLQLHLHLQLQLHLHLQLQLHLHLHLSVHRALPRCC